MSSSAVQNLPLDFTCYRTRFFVCLAQRLLAPLSLTYLLLALVAPYPSAFHPLVIAAYALSPVLWLSLTSRYTNWSSDRRARQLGALPIPRVTGKWPGNVDIVLRLARDSRRNYLLQAMADLFDEYRCDTLNTRILWSDTIITRDDLHMRAVHASSFDSFERGFDALEKMGSFLGHGLFVTDGEEWRHNRALVRPFLSKDRVSDFDTLTKHSDLLLAILASSAALQEPLDIQDLFARFTLDAGAELLFGATPDALAAPRPTPFHARIGPKGSALDDECSTFCSTFEKIQVDIALRWRLGSLWPLRELLSDSTLKNARLTMDWVAPIVKQAFEQKARMADLDLKHEERILLESMANHSNDEETVCYGLLNVLMASRDSTAALLTFAVYLLTQHPDVRDRLHAEIVEVCGPSGIPTHASIRTMTYMNAVLNETLRLFAPAPTGTRNSVTEVLFPARTPCQQPLYLAAGARVTWLTLLLHRRTDLWGADAHAFDPARWLDARAARVVERPSMFVPFLSGPRTCPGQLRARAEAAFLLTRVLQRFPDIALAPDAIPAGAAPPAAWTHGRGRAAVERCWPMAALTTFVKGGLWVRVDAAASGGGR